MSEGSKTNVVVHIGQTYVGQQGRYKIVSMLGAGGMGVVCKAIIEASGHEVAVKFLHDELQEDSISSRERFEREIKVLLELKAFRGIVKIEDWGRTPGGSLFFVMELIKAPTLDQIIERNPQGLSQIRAVQIVLEALIILEPIHHRGFVHRDLKPHNMAVAEDPLSVQLLDFGLSKPIQEGEGFKKVTRRIEGKAAEIPGSPHYMAVEQFLRPKSVDKRTDLYAMGVILYELLAGIPPFRGIYLQDILRQHRESAPPPLDQAADGTKVSYRLQAVINKALAKDPAQRYQDAAEFKEALYDVLNSLNRALRPKKALDTAYRIIRKLGQGGNSEVYEAESLADGTRVAVKIAREGSSDWDEETLMNEADRALSHENIVKVIEFGSFENRPALVMELMPGGTIEDLLQKHKQAGLPEDLFFRVMIDACRGLHHAHLSNIVHRDVKPGNLLIDPHGKTKVCDFGIAKRFEQQGQTITGSKNTVLAKGTAQYMPPEQCDPNGRVDRRSDVYSLGVMMYEMLSGEVPFTEGVIIMQQIQSDPPPLTIRGTYKNPVELAKVVEKCMMKDREKRFQSMKDVALELFRISKLEPQKAPQKPYVFKTLPPDLAKDDRTESVALGSGERAAMPAAGRKPILLIAAAAVVVIGVVGYVLATRNGGPNPGPGPVEDLAAKAFTQATNVINEGNWIGLEAVDLSVLDEARRADLCASAAGIVRAQLPRDVNGRDDGKSLATMQKSAAEMAAGVARIKPDHPIVEALKKLSEAAPEIDKAATAGADGLLPWLTEECGKIDLALDGLAKAGVDVGFVVKSETKNLVNRRAAVNAATLKGQIEAARTSETAPAHFAATIERLEPLRRDSAEIDRSVTDALEGAGVWLAAAAAKKTEVAPAFAWLTKDGPQAIGLAATPATVFADYVASYRDDAASGRRLKAPKLGEIPAYALASLQSNQKTAVDGWFAKLIGGEPTQWEKALSTLDTLGMPAEVSTPSLVAGLERVLAKGEAFEVFAAKQFDKNDPAAAEPKAKAIAATRDAFLNRLTGLAADDRARLVRTFDAVVAMYQPGGADLQFQALRTRRDELERDSNAPLPDLAALVADARRIIDSASAKPEQKDEAQTIRQAVFEKLRSSGRTVSNLLLSIAADPARKEALASDFAAGIVKSPLSGAALRGEDAGMRLNKAWRESGSTLIAVELAWPECALLGTKSVRVSCAGGDVVAAAAADRLTLKLPPSKALVETKQGAFSVWAVRVELTVVADKVTGGECVLSWNHPIDPTEIIDVDAPVLAVSAALDAGDALRGLVTVLSTDNGKPAPQIVPTATFAGTKLLPAGTKDGAALFELPLDAFADKAAGEITIEAIDAAGNAGKAALERAVVDGLKREMIARAVDVCQRAVDQAATAMAANPIGATAFEDAKSKLAEIESLFFAKYQAFDEAAFKRLAQRLADGWADVSVKGWQAKAPAKAPAAEVEAWKQGFGEVVGRVGEFAAKWIDSAAKARIDPLRDAFAQWAEERKEAISGGSSANNGNQGSNSGNSSGNNSNSGSSAGASRIGKRSDVSAAGMTFKHVEITEKQESVWVATVELSKAAAERILAGIADDARNLARTKFADKDWNGLADDAPLVPLSPNVATKIVAALNAKEGGSLKDQCGLEAEFAIPTAEQWKAAAVVQFGNESLDGAAWSGKNQGSEGFYCQMSDDKRAPFYSNLRGIASDPAAGPFHFMSGNAAEIVRVGAASFGLRGGGLNDFRGNKNNLKLKSQMSLSAANIEVFSGLRVVIQPKK